MLEALLKDKQQNAFKRIRKVKFVVATFALHIFSTTFSTSTFAEDPQWMEFWSSVDKRFLQKIRCESPSRHICKSVIGQPLSLMDLLDNISFR